MGYKLYNQDCLDWLRRQDDCTIHAVVTDPPFGIKEYLPHEVEKMRVGKGGVWRLPPTIGGSKRSPLPRFTVLTREEINQVNSFFLNLSKELYRVLVPGAHVVVASNSLLAPFVFSGIAGSGLEPRGQIIRLVRTFRGGDRPKGAESEFSGVSTMPRACHEPWGIFRKPLEGTVAQNLRKWKTGGIGRLSDESPLPDVIECSRTPVEERKISPHPSLKPQNFMRKIVKVALPLGEGLILDPFMGGGSTIAAAEHCGYDSIGIELDSQYYELADRTIKHLSALYQQGDSLFYSRQISSR